MMASFEVGAIRSRAGRTDAIGSKHWAGFRRSVSGLDKQFVDLGVSKPQRGIGRMNA